MSFHTSVSFFPPQSLCLSSSFRVLLLLCHSSFLFTPFSSTFFLTLSFTSPILPPPHPVVRSLYLKCVCMAAQLSAQLGDALQTPQSSRQPERHRPHCIPLHADTHTLTHISQRQMQTHSCWMTNESLIRSKCMKFFLCFTVIRYKKEPVH